MPRLSLNPLYLDNHLIAVYKPFGVLTQSDPDIDSLYKQTKSWLKNKFNKPGNVYLGLLHRLDRPVAGVVLLRVLDDFFQHIIACIGRNLFIPHG